MHTDHLQCLRDLAWKQTTSFLLPLPFHRPVFNLLVSLGCSGGLENVVFLEPRVWRGGNRFLNTEQCVCHSCLTYFPEMIVNYDSFFFSFLIFPSLLTTLSHFFFQDSLLFLHDSVFSVTPSLIKNSSLLGLCSPSVILSIFLASAAGGFHFHLYHPYFCLDLLVGIFKCLPGISIQMAQKLSNEEAPKKNLSPSSKFTLVHLFCHFRKWTITQWFLKLQMRGGGVILDFLTFPSRYI